MGRKRTVEKPETEVKLEQLQKEYLRERDGKIYQQMFLEMLPYTKSLVLKTTKGRIFIATDKVDAIAKDAVIKVMSQYEREDFRIEKSFAGYLQFKILESMYHPRIMKEDMIGLLNSLIEESQVHTTEMGDLPEAFDFTYLFRPTNADITDDPATYLFNEKKDAINSVTSVIKDVQKSTNVLNRFHIVIGITQFIRKLFTYEKFKERYCSDEEKKAIEFVILEMHKRLSNVA
jgi:hypothetical protein